jgi:cytochrome c553
MSETENKVSQERQPIHPARKIVFGSLISLSILPIAMLLIAVLWSVKPMIKQSSAQDDAAQEIAAANGHAKSALINFTTCATCHGINGEGNPKMHAPRIADLAPWYVKAQLEKFKSGLRGVNPTDVYGQTMRPMALQVQDVDAMAKIVSDLEGHRGRFAPAGPVITGNAKHGQILYAQCVACHGANGLGERGVKSPAIAGQESWYVQQQLMNFRSGTRGILPADREGNLMRVIVAPLSDSDIADLAIFVNAMGNRNTVTPQ